MAGIFSQTLGTDVSPMQPVEQPSAAGAAFKLGEAFASALGQERRRSAPTYTEQKDKLEAAALEDYTNQLDKFQQQFESGAINASTYKRNLSTLNLSFLGRGVDISGTAFKYARQSITGVEEEDFGLSESEIFINDLKKSETGKGELAFAALELSNQGVEQTPEALAGVVQARMARATALNNITVQDELSWRRAKPVFIDQVSMFKEDTQAAIDGLTRAGVEITPDMLQNRYLEFTNLKMNLESRIPSSIPLNEKEDLFKDFGRIDQMFVSLGMTREDGVIKIKTKDELQLANKARLAVKALNKSESEADHILAMQITDADYKMTPEQYTLLTTRLDALDDETSIQPDWVNDANIVVTNDLMGTYSNLVAYETSDIKIGLDRDEALKDGAISLVNPEEREKWLGMTNAQGWTATKAFGTASKGFSKEAILSGKMTDGFYNTMAGLALSFESIDVVSEPVSFAGVRSEINAQLPNMIKTAKAVDPVKGSAIETMMFRAITTQKVQYDKLIDNTERALKVTFDPEIGGYTISGAASDGRTLQLKTLLDAKYGGNLENLYRDNFNSVTLQDIVDVVGGSVESYQMSGQNPQLLAQALFGDVLPSQADLKTVADYRSSSVYLSRLATQIEPEEYKTQRDEAVAAKEAAAPASMSAYLIDKFEAGSGGYSTLFNQSQNGPFAGVDVSRMTLDQLYEFSDTSGPYAKYVKETNPKGVLATPMGRYQFVGTTLKEVAKEMGLSGETIFNKETQDAMFLHLARKVMSGKRQAGKRDALRSTWDGFRNASDQQLNAMIAEIEGGNVDLGGSMGPAIPAVTTTTTLPDRVNIVDVASAAIDRATTAAEPVPVDTVPVETNVFDQTTTGNARAAGEAGRGGQAGGETNARDATAAAVAGPTMPPEIVALLQALTQRDLTDEEKKKIQDFIGAQ